MVILIQGTKYALYALGVPNNYPVNDFPAKNFPPACRLNGITLEGGFQLVGKGEHGEKYHDHKDYRCYKITVKRWNAALYSEKLKNICVKHKQQYGKLK